MFGIRIADRNLTDSTQLPFQLEGHARAVANMSIGQITLDPIKFDVTSGLDGLQGLNNLVTIGSVDVLGGTQDAIQLGINGECRRRRQLRVRSGRGCVCADAGRCLQ